ncbi:hypothetical protein TRFO_35591 [Tritrichomonas foetus]|uniref:Uncharacterized protein n=1 Tax=Tritrichomonas foetus TaxID=1144522 RepID=A0A1J4JKH2_9EUKA|nr:hypothetical protein TRFO_35591 [Tritrichomonas foetus]|eukprot:OHS98061.1 hypothetical protein TRFO_35591 [Tritrichomonas foetus]
MSISLESMSEYFVKIRGPFLLIPDKREKWRLPDYFFELTISDNIKPEVACTENSCLYLIYANNKKSCIFVQKYHFDVSHAKKIDDYKYQLELNEDQLEQSQCKSFTIKSFTVKSPIQLTHIFCSNTYLVVGYLQNASQQFWVITDTYQKTLENGRKYFNNDLKFPRDFSWSDKYLLIIDRKTCTEPIIDVFIIPEENPDPVNNPKDNTNNDSIKANTTITLPNDLAGLLFTLKDNILYVFRKNTYDDKKTEFRPQFSIYQINDFESLTSIESKLNYEQPLITHKQSENQINDSFFPIYFFEKDQYFYISEENSHFWQINKDGYLSRCTSKDEKMLQMFKHIGSSKFSASIQEKSLVLNKQSKFDHESLCDDDSDPILEALYNI